MKIYYKEKEKYIYIVDYCCRLSSIHFSGLHSHLKINDTFSKCDFVFENFIIKFCPFCGATCEAEGRSK